MKMKYTKPETVIEYYDKMDVLTASGGGSSTNPPKDDFETDEMPIGF